MKRCSMCGEEKPLDQFHLQKRNGQPIARCKACRSAVASQRHRERRAADPEYDQRIKEYVRKAYEKRRDKPGYREQKQVDQRDRTAREREELAAHPDSTKFCSACEQEKSLSEFYPGQVFCKSCSKQKAADYITSRRQSEPAYREKVNASNRQRYYEKRASESNEARQLANQRRRERLLERKLKEQEAAQLEGRTLQPRLCADCGADISGRYRNAKICTDCKRARRQKTVRSYVERSRDKTK